MLKLKAFMFRCLCHRFFYSQFYLDDGTPVKCWKCLSVEFKAQVWSDISGTVAESEIQCARCDQSLAYWAYGSYAPNDWPGVVDRYIEYVKKRFRLWKYRKHRPFK